jgi:hypothetical protein
LNMEEKAMKTFSGTTTKLYRKIMLVTVAAIMLLTVSFAVAQMGGGPGGPAMRGPLYNVSTETTVRGTVVEVQQLTAQTAGSNKATWRNCPRGWAGTHVVVKTEEGSSTVHVGPSAYLAQKNFVLAKGDKVTITGSKVQYQGSDFLIAKEITMGDQFLTLRDARGLPLWSGARQGMPMPNPPGN